MSTNEPPSFAVGPFKFGMAEWSQFHTAGTWRRRSLFRRLSAVSFAIVAMLLGGACGRGAEKENRRTSSAAESTLESADSIAGFENGAQFALVFDQESPIVEVDDVIKIRVFALNEDGEPVLLTKEKVKWSVEDQNLVRIKRSRDTVEVFGKAVGITTLTARLGGISASLLVAVTPSTLVGIEVSPAQVDLATGLIQQFRCLGISSTGTRRDLTSYANWSTTSSQIAKIDGDGRAKGKLVGTTVVVAAFAAFEGKGTLTVTDAIVTGIEIAPSRLSLAVGDRSQLHATALLSDGATADVTDQVQWTARGDAGLFSATVLGELTAVQEGMLKVHARLTNAQGKRLSATADVSVDAAQLRSIAIDPPMISLPVGLSTALRATGLYSDGTSRDVSNDVIWTLANTALAEVKTEVTGSSTLSARGIGQTRLQATSGKVLVSINVEVTDAILTALSVTPRRTQVPVGFSQIFVTTGSFSDGTSRDVSGLATWTSSNPSVLTLSNAAGEQGLGRGQAPGESLVTAAYRDISTTVKVAVRRLLLRSIAVTPPLASVAKGMTVSYVATGTFAKDDYGVMVLTHDITRDVIWASSDDSIAMVSNAAADRGLAIAIDVGKASISANAAGRTRSVPVVVTGAEIVGIEIAPPKLHLALGTTAQLRVTAVYSDGSKADATTQCFFSSSRGDIASVGNTGEGSGMVTGVGVGEGTVSANLGSLLTATTVSVVPSTLRSIEIRPLAPSLPRGTSVFLTATGHFDDGSRVDLTSDASWESLAPEVAAVGAFAGDGVPLLGLEIGQTIIRVQFGTVVGEATATVSAPALVGLEIVPDAITLGAGQTRSLAAFAKYSDGGRFDVTQSALWTSDAEAVVAVSNARDSIGHMTGIAAGSTMVHANWNEAGASSNVTVSPAALIGIDVSPAVSTLHLGQTLAMRAFGRYEDQSTREITGEVVWESSLPTVAAVRNDGLLSGQAVALGIGRASISATVGAVSGSGVLSVNEARLVEIEIGPLAPAVPAGLSVALTAIGRYEDQTTRVLTNEVVWSSADREVASVTGALPDPGVLTGVAPGEAAITAALGGISTETRILVVDAVVVSLALTLSRDSVPLGSTTDAQVIANYSDGRAQTVTGLSTFTSSDIEVAAIKNEMGARGEVSTRGVGRTVISAVYGELSASATLAVTDAELLSIAIAGPSTSLPLGLARPFVARGTFTDRSVVDLTRTVTWTAGDATVAAVSNDPIDKGLVTPLSIGATVIRATQGAISGEISLGVDDAVLVGMRISPLTPRVRFGDSTSLHVEGTFSDGSVFDLTEVATWTSDNPGVALVTNLAGARGLVTGVQRGTTTIRAYYGDQTGDTKIVVEASLLALEVSPRRTVVAVGEQVQFDCQGTYEGGSTEDLTEVSQWVVADPALATVAIGQVTGRRVGSTTVSAVFGGLTASASIRVDAPRLLALEVTPASLSLAKGTTLSLAVAAVYSDGSRQRLGREVARVSAQEDIATINENLEVFGAAVGTTTLLLKYNEVETNVPVIVLPPSMRALALDPPNAALASGATVTLTAVATYSDGTSGVVENPAFAIENGTVAALVEGGRPGIIRGIAVGESVVSASYAGFVALGLVRVTAPDLAAVIIRPAYVQLSVGASASLLAVGRFSDGSESLLASPVEWASSQLSVATISGTGSLTALSVGTATVTAAVGSIISEPVPIEVIAARLVQLTLIPDHLLLAKGRSAAIQAIAWYSDSSFNDVSGLAIWESSAPDIASVSFEGVVAGGNIGIASVSASFLGQTATVDVTILPAVMDQVAIAPLPGLPAGRSATLTAVASFSDGAEEILANGVVWRTSRPSDVIITPEGIVTAMRMGTAEVRAEYGGLAAVGIVTITAAVVDTLVVAGPQMALTPGSASQMTATAVYSDRSTANVTDDAAWQIIDPEVASVDDRGLILALAEGTTTVSATFEGITGSLTFAVGDSASFAALCLDLTIGTATRATIAAILDQLDTEDCRAAEERLNGAGSLNLAGRDLTDLSPLSILTSLRWLYLDRNDLTDLSPLAALAELRGLYLDDNSVSDISPLSGLPHLAHVSLDRNPLATLAPLAGKASIVNLSVNGVDGADLSALSELPGLRGLYADGPAALNAMENARLDTLSALSVRQGSLSGIELLAQASQLRWLDLSSNSITNASPLAALGGIEGLILGSNPIGREIGACPVVAPNQPLASFCLDYLFW